MARLEPRPVAELTEHAESLAAVEAFMGFVPNSLPTMAHVPGLVPAFVQLGAACQRNGLLPADLVPMLAHVTSAAAGCRYCQAHTAHTAEQREVSPDKIAALWEFETSELFSEAERSALRLAFHAGMHPNGVTDEDFAAAREHWSTEQLAAIVAVCALFGFLNRWNDTVATTLEEGPTGFAAEVLGPHGWEPGKHA